MPHHAAHAATQTVRQIRRRIGVNLHAARADRGMTMPKLAQLSGVPVPAIDKIELGKGEADLHTILRLCAVLKVDFAKLLA